MPSNRCRTILSLSASLAAFVGVSLPENHATACSIACAAGALLPSAGDIPVDQVRFRWDPLLGKAVGRIDGGTSLPRLYQLVGPARVEVALRVTQGDAKTLWIAPDQGLPVGTQLVLEAPSCGDVPLRGEYTITEAAPPPSELGTLQVSLHRDNLRVASSRSCSLPVDIAYADLTVKPADSARPYAALFDYRVFVDGQLHPDFTTSIFAPTPLAQGEKRIFAACRADTYFRNDAALTPGVHRVRVTGLVDGKELATPEIEVDLSCTGTPPAWEPDSDLGPGARASTRDGGAEDASFAGTIFVGDGGSSDETSTSGNQESGCALRAADAAERTAPGWLAMIGIALTLRLRRRNLQS